MDYFDLHCDTVLRLCDQKESLEDAGGHLSMEKAQSLNRYAQVYALFVHDRFSGEAAWRQYRRELDCIKRQEKLLGDAFFLCRSAAELTAALDAPARAGILSIENGKAFGGRLERVQQAADDGVRMLTLTWFGENELGYGSGIGGRLKPFGYAVLKECRRCGIIPDISHLSDEGVEDVLAADDGVFIASHSNARQVTPHFRNLTDEMITQLIRRQGLIGINFASGFLNTEKEKADVSDICRHILYFLEHGCEDILAFGSDFDGAHLPQELSGIDEVKKIREQLDRMGIPADVLQNIFFDNALHFFERTLGGTQT